MSPHRDDGIGNGSTESHASCLARVIRHSLQARRQLRGERGLLVRKGVAQDVLGGGGDRRGGGDPVGRIQVDEVARARWIALSTSKTAMLSSAKARLA